MSLNELTNLGLQQRAWLDMSNTTNPHWSYIEFMNSYFDDLYLDDDYQYQLSNGYIDHDEYELIKDWHSQLREYKTPNGNVHKHAAILKDDKWLFIVALGKKMVEALGENLCDEEQMTLCSDVDHTKYL